MKQAMQMLGFEKDDLNTRKRRDQFHESVDTKSSPKAANTVVNVMKTLNTIEPEEVDEQLTTLRYKHY